MLSLLWPSWTTPSSIKSVNFCAAASNSMTLCTEYQVCDHAQAIVTDAYVTNTYDSRAHCGSTPVIQDTVPSLSPP